MNFKINVKKIKCYLSFEYIFIYFKTDDIHLINERKWKEENPNNWQSLHC